MKVPKWGTFISCLVVATSLPAATGEVFTVDLRSSVTPGMVDGHFVIHDTPGDPRIEFNLALRRVDVPQKLSLDRTNEANPAVWETVHDWSGVQPHERWLNRCTRDGPPPSTCGYHGYLPLTTDLLNQLRAGTVLLRLQESGLAHQSDVAARIIPVEEAGKVAITNIRTISFTLFGEQQNRLEIRFDGLAPREYQLWASTDMETWTNVVAGTSYRGQGGFSVDRATLGDLRFFRVRYDPADQP